MLGKGFTSSGRLLELIGDNTEIRSNCLARNLRVNVGDPALGEFDGKLHISCWDAKCSLTLGTPVSTNVGLFDNRPRVTINEIDCTHYIDEKNNGFEWSIYLPIKPRSNILTYQIETEKLEFIKQLPLSEEEKLDGCKRPENVVNSYAVYHSTGKGNYVNTETGEERLFGTGKAFHIYRPKAIDSVGNNEWCDLDIDSKSGTLTITVPLSFWNVAIFPLTIDPDIGYTSVGASSWAQSTYALGFRYQNHNHTASASEEITEYHIYAGASGASDIELGCYTENPSSPYEPQTRVHLSGAFGSGTGWLSITGKSDALVNGTTYTVVAGNNTSNFTFVYDSLSIALGRQTGTTLGSTWSTSSVRSYNISMYYVVEVGSTNIEITPDVQEIEFSNIEPTIILGSVSVTPIEQYIDISMIEPSIILGSIGLTPANMSIELSLIEPTIILGGVSIIPDIQSIDISIVEPTIIYVGDIDLTPDVINFDITIIEPAIFLSGGVATTIHGLEKKHWELY